MPLKTNNAVCQRYRALILDFDGVLVESNAVKDKAFALVFADHPGHLQEIMEYHRGTSLIRFEKFRHIVENILRRPYTPQLQDELAAQFSQYCIQEVSACPWVKGAAEFLEAFSRHRPLYLVSINPMEDLKEILARRGLTAYFKKVYAARASKTPQLKEILAEENMASSEAVFIGDSLNDYHSAREAGMDFIGRRSAELIDLQAAPVFQDMQTIADYLDGTILCRSI